MAKFQDYFRIVEPKPSVSSMTDSSNIGDQGAYANYTWYQRLIQGSASRLTRYREYDLMDNDVQVARSLDMIAEHMVGTTPSFKIPFELDLDSDKQRDIEPHIVMTIKTALHYWCSIHQWNNRIFELARTMIKYGDIFFVRHSDVSKWEYVHPKHVIAAIVEEHDITNVQGWQIKRDVKKSNSPYSAQLGGYGYVATDQTETFPQQDIVWFTHNSDMGESAPFGESILRAVYRVQKQKELLEDSIIIYRIQRAPERRVFYIDVGKMPPQRVKAYLEQIKNEIRQRRIPSFQGGKAEIDTAYNPQTMNEDFFFAQRPDGRGSKVETLPGGAGLGELADLEYFQERVLEGLRVPVSYWKQQDGGIFNDGKTGVAYIQELIFANFVARLQRSINHVMDREFKRYLQAAGIMVDFTSFTIKLPLPQNFGTYRQQMLDNDLLTTFNNANNALFLSKRFIMKRYLQLSDAEIAANEYLLREEKGLLTDKTTKADLLKLYGDQMGAQPGMGGTFGGAGVLPPPGMPMGEPGMPPLGGEELAAGGPVGEPGMPPPSVGTEIVNPPT